MLKTIIILPDETEMSSGAGNIVAIQRSTITECVNSENELTIGSVCANQFKATIFAPEGQLNIAAGTEVSVLKEDDGGRRYPAGHFILDKPTRATANTFSVTGYDRVSKLDKDLTAWLAGLTGWPHKLNDFAAAVCAACGLNFVATDVPNMEYEIQQFSKSSVTGRQLMRWLGEICCSFCRADVDGNIEFAWYTPAEAQITPTGDSYYFQNGLSYEDYAVAPVEAVQLRLADSENGALWPLADEGANSYVITGNPILTRSLDQEILQPVLDNILARLAETTYTPCKVSVPATMNIHAGNTVRITDKNGVTFTAYVMTKTQAGQKDILESTGSARRDSSSEVNNKTQAEKDAAMEGYANSAAQNAVRAQTAEEVLRRLTNDYQIQGLWQENGEWYFNAQAVHVLNLVAELITAGTLKSADGTTYFDLDSGVFVSKGENGYTTTFENGSILLKDPSGKTRLAVAYFTSGEISLMLYNNNGSPIGGLMEIGGDLVFSCRDIKEGNISGRRVGWRNIKCELEDGTQSIETVLMQY